MIPYSRDPSQPVPSHAIKIIGLGGAGTNMLERIAMDGIEGAELIALNTDSRTLGSCLSKEKIQLGENLTKGLGTGGDPDLGRQAVLEAEMAVRAAVAGRRIVLIATGLGGGTGSGAAPIVTRIAREEGAFVVVFATMPFTFEGKRRREQAESSLNELMVLANAMVTFDNNRMGELVVAKQGIHEAFQAADQAVSEAIKAVIRIVTRPGLINLGLDELVSALRATRSRCLFGSGLASGKDRASRALRKALASPLLDQGALLRDAQTVLVHLSGGEDLTLCEIELLMQGLQKHISADAQVLFGAAVDPAMGNSLSLTLISALPEDALIQREASINHAIVAEAMPAPTIALSADNATALPGVDDAPGSEPAPDAGGDDLLEQIRPTQASVTQGMEIDQDPGIDLVANPTPDLFEPGATLEEPLPPTPGVAIAEFVSAPPAPASDATYVDPEPAPSPVELDPDFDTSNPSGYVAIPRKRPASRSPWANPESAADPTPTEVPSAEPSTEPELPKLKPGKSAGPQSELSLGELRRGRFDGELPNLIDGEDLDVPAYLRKKR